ncbi:MAG TPA: DnaJ domain-containing protein [Flavitalea sp.]|nr:DnaJ domain-containing protein [Flavitalea sp.]HTF27732.1 DnaJ domain-containing protein [Flavitalea sp.]
MRLKDYYKILNVSPTAGAHEIRKAFRVLALKYHPDKTQGDKYKEGLFREVQEAYEILSDHKKREEYNYQRWYTRSLGKSYSEQAITPQEILRETKKLSNYILSVNSLHIDYDILSSRIRSLLASENIEVLLQFNELSVNRQIIGLLLKTAEPLPFRYVEPISILMAKVAGTDNELLQQIKSYSRQRMSREYWEKRKVWLVIIATVLICWLMYIYAS